MKQDYPVFLSKLATGEDKFEGASQANLAGVISQIIKENKLEKKVLGIEGDWGAGKTNLIKIIQSKLGTDYHTFIFDAWGSQEDLTRKSFLEQLINELFKKEYLTDKDRWKDLKNRLLSTTSTTHTQKFPLIKRHVLVLSLSLLLLTLLLGTYEYVGQEFDFIGSIYFGFWKPILWIYLIPLVIFQWGFRLTVAEYNEERLKNAEKDLIEQDSRWQTIGKLFYWFNGNDINSEEVQNIIEDDPSVKQFREYFGKIEDEIKNKGKLILVFDNLDRLEKDKLKSLWSSIHTFFAEDNKSFDSWVIVPYDRKRLRLHLDNGFYGFINKTFSLNFRVTPPVVRQWEKFLNEKLDEAFGKKLVSQEEREYAIKLFDILTPTPTITPRQVINYINNLVSMYRIWKEDIENKNLKFRYLALFVLAKDNIVEKPHESILNREYLGGAESFFRDDEDLDTNISMITFGVKKELADEVLLDRRLKTALRQGDDPTIKSSLKHRAFQKYFIQAYRDTSLNEKYKGLTKILETVEDVFSENLMATFWEDFGSGIISIESQFDSFNENHKAILKNTNNKTGKKVLLHLINTLKSTLNSGKSQEKYFTQLLLVEKYIDSESIEIDLFELITKVEFIAESYLKFLKSTKENYGKYKIDCSQNELVDWFFIENGDLNVNIVETSISELGLVKEKYDFTKIIDNVKNRIKSVTHNDHVNLGKYLKISKTLLDEPIELELAPPYYTQLTSAKLDSNEVYVDAFCIAISNFQVAYNNSPNFRTSLSNLTEDQIKKILSVIEKYITYGSLLRLLTSNSVANGYSKLKDIVHGLTIDNNKMNLLNIDWVVKNFDDIRTKVFNDEKEKVEKFAERINGWSAHFKANPRELSDGLLEYFNREDLELIKIIIKKALGHCQGLSKEELLESFRTENKDFKILSALVNHDCINKFSDAFYSAYDDFIKGIASEKEQIPNPDIWNMLIDKMNKNKLRSTYTTVRDILINERGELKEEELSFLEKGLIKHGNLDKKPESATLKIVIPLIESDTNFENVFLERFEEFLPIIDSSKEHKETAIGELQLKYESEKFKTNERMVEIAKRLDLKEKDKSSENGTES